MRKLLEQLGNRVRQSAHDDSGNAAISIVFVIFTIIIGTVLGSIAVNIVQQSGAVNAYSNLNAAVDQRVNDYVATVSTGGTTPLAQICYTDLASCVTIPTATTTGNQTTLTLNAVYGGQSGQKLTRTRVLTVTTASHISGYDLSGNPVWVTAPGSPKLFTGYAG